MMEDLMGTPDWQLRESNSLLQLGVLLLLISMVIGILVKFNQFATPLFGLSAHLITLLEGFFLLLFGLVWPRLKLPRTASRIAFWTGLYSCLWGSLVCVLAAVWGAGGEMPIAAAGAKGSNFHEAFIRYSFYSIALTTITILLFVFWGLRAAAKEQIRDGSA
jgi:(hydroxyamino)benzene mutase